MVNIIKSPDADKLYSGVILKLTGDEIALAIMAYLTTHDIHTFGPMTITVNGELCKEGQVYIDPLGFIIKEGKKIPE